VVFLQQLGRGLRLSPETGKSCLTVLDFIGQQHRRFRFDQRFRALLDELRALASEGVIGPGSGLADWLEALAMEPADFYAIRGAGLLHLDDPDRLRATAAALAAPTPPDPGRLGERERRQWLMLTAQLFGTGKRWRPLPDALALLWQASAWRDELRQLLELLAERTDRRLHPLPWALPVPLRVHGRYSRVEIEAACCFAEA
jgi:hypothetical protein